MNKQPKQPAGRMRQFHPGFIYNERLIECSPGARLLYLCLNLYTDRDDFLKITLDQINDVYFPSEDMTRFRFLNELVVADLAEITEPGKVRMLHVSDSFCKERKTWSQVHSANRRAAKRNAMPAWACRDGIKEIYDRARSLAFETGETYHVDHVIPLQHEKVCGLHVPANLEIILAEDNIRKSNRYEVA